MEILDGKIADYSNGIITAKADFNNTERFCRISPGECLIVLKDSRTITAEQRKKAYALLGEIADYMGEMPEYTKRLFKLKFIHDELKGIADDVFSLSNCDVTIAHDFITYLIDFIIAHEIPTKVPLAELCEDVEKFVYSCAMKKYVACAGRKRNYIIMTR